MNQNITKILSALIQELRTEKIPDEIMHFAKMCILDYLGVCLAGAYELNDKNSLYLKWSQSGDGEIKVIGSQNRATVYDAALLNGISAHCLELDDGNRYGMLHLGAPVLSALFAIAGKYNVEPGLFIRAMITGYEVANRLSAAIQPEHKKRGFHATGTCGCIGAAAAVAVALNVDQNKMENILSVAAASCSGLLEMIDGGSQLKAFNAGKAAQNGICAVFMGDAGYCGPEDAIGGKRGLVGAMAAGVNIDWFERSNEKKYTITDAYRKPYASCRHCHSAVEAALIIRKENSFSYSGISGIMVQTYGLAVLGHDHTSIQGTESAKMSTPYSIAAALVLGEGGMEAVSKDAIEDTRILNLAKKVKLTENPDYTALVPGKRIARVAVKLNDGRLLDSEVIFPKGEPENPMTDREIECKFCQLAMYAGKTKEECGQIVDCVKEFEKKYVELMAML